jgi:hypothetical protein
VQEERYDRAPAPAQAKTAAGRHIADRRKQQTFMLTLDRDALIRAEYHSQMDGRFASGDRVEESITLAPLHLELLGIFDDWLHKQQITRRLEIEVFGSLLYQTLFAGKVGDLFEKVLHQTFDRPPDEQLQVHLRFDKASHFERLPWEFLYTPELRSLHRRFFLATSKALTLTRSLTSPRSPSDQKVETPLRILLVLSNPSPLSNIDPAPMLSTLEALADRCSLEVKMLDKPTLSNFSHELEIYLPHFVHFIGHTRSEETGTSSVALASDSGTTKWIRDREFADMFAWFDRNLSPRVLIFHSVGGSTLGPHLMEAGVDDVIELRYPTTQAAAHTFFRTFYMAVGRGAPVDVAVQHARGDMIQRGVGSGDTVYFGSPAYYASAVESTYLVPAKSEPKSALVSIVPEAAWRPKRNAG